MVKWEGYDETYNSWEPYSEIKSTEAFKQYCLNNNLQYLIPKQYKTNDGVIPVWVLNNQTDILFSSLIFLL